MEYEFDIEKSNGYELALMGAAGVLLMLAGYRIKKIAFFLLWFILGYTLMGYVVPVINQNVPEIATNTLWQVLLPIAGGLLLALLGFTIEKICVAGITFGVTIMIAAQYFGTGVMTLVIAAVVGVILGAVAVRLMKPAIILLTSIAGSYALTVALLHWLTTIDQTVFYFPMLIGFAVVGAVVQFTVTAKHTS